MSSPARLNVTQRTSRGRNAQRGISLVAMALVLGVMALVVFGIGLERIRMANESAGRITGYALNQVSQGVDQYRTTNYAALTGAAPAVVGFANAMQPTVAELKAAGYINNAVANTLPDGSAYNIVFQKNPAGCVAPGMVCNVWSRLWLSNPILDIETGRPSITRLSALLGAVSQTGGYSSGPDLTQITGANGAWTIPNPDGAQRAGIVVVVAGLGGDPFPYLRVRDTRDPLFQNQVTGAQFVTPFVTPGGFCNNQGAFASTDHGVYFCNQNVWRSYTGPAVTPGTGCVLDGAMGVTTAGASLICVSGTWRDHLTYGFRTAGYFGQGQVVPRPTCGPGNSPSAVIAAVQSSVIIGANNPGNNTGSFQARLDSTSWVVTIIGADGSQAGVNAQALVQTFCS